MFNLEWNNVHQGCGHQREKLQVYFWAEVLRSSVNTHDFHEDIHKEVHADVVEIQQSCCVGCNRTRFESSDKYQLLHQPTLIGLLSIRAQLSGVRSGISTITVGFLLSYWQFIHASDSDFSVLQSPIRSYYKEYLKVRSCWSVTSAPSSNTGMSSMASASLLLFSLHP